MRPTDPVKPATCEVITYFRDELADLSECTIGACGDRSATAFRNAETARSEVIRSSRA